MSKRSILIVTGMSSTKYGGMEQYFVNLIRFAKSNDLEYNWVLQYESMPQSVEYLKDLEELEATIVVTKTWGNPIRAALNSLLLMITIRPTIIHTHFVINYALLLLPICAKLLGARKTVSTCHNHLEYTEKHTRRHAYNRFDKVLAVSRAVADDLIVCGVDKNKLQTHYLGLWGERDRTEKIKKEIIAEFNLPDSQTVFATLAFDGKMKGLDVLLRAIAALKKEGLKISWISIGVDPSKSKLPALAQELEIEDEVHWAGIKANGWQVLSAADVYIQPSRSSEGLPFAIMEAMAMRLPVLATNVSGNIEAVIDKETGLVAEPDNIESLARCIKQMIQNKGMWASYGENGFRRFSEMFKGEDSVSGLLFDHFNLGKKQP